MSSYEAFGLRLQQLTNGEIPVERGFNDFVGHVDTLNQLLKVCPGEIEDDLTYLRDAYSAGLSGSGMALLSSFPKLIDPELAVVEGRISDFIAERYGIRLDDGEYRGGKLLGVSCCEAWPSVCSPLSNNRFPYAIDTSAANYFGNQFWQCDREEDCRPRFMWVPPGGRVTFAGEYMHARYFAFHPNDIDSNALGSLVDVDLEPDTGSANPFRGPVPDGMRRRFTAHFDFSDPPAEPAPNTRYVGTKKNGGANMAVLNTLRIAGADMGALPPNSAGVLLPSVTISDAQGNVVRRYEEADPYPPGYQPPLDTTKFAALPIPDHRGIYNAGKLDTKHNWGVAADLLASRDYLYVSSQYSHRHGEIFVVRAKALTTPRTPQEPVYAEGKQVRSWTLNTYNIWAGVSRQAKQDYEVVLDGDGYYTVVVCAEADLPSNATAQNGVTWVDWGPYLDGQLTWRFLMSRDPWLVQLKQAIDTGEESAEIAPYVPRVGHCSIAAFEESGWSAAIPQRPLELLALAE